MSTNLRSGRPRCAWLSPGERLRWGDAIRALLRENPDALVADLSAKTGAPPELTRQVKAKFKQRQVTP